MIAVTQSHSDHRRSIPSSRLARATRSSVCLRIQPAREGHADHRPRCQEIAASLAARTRAARRSATTPSSWKTSRRGRSPTCPPKCSHDMETSDVSIFAVKAQPNELRTRMQMTDVVNRRKMRHAHMVNIDRRIMLEGMRADFDEVDRISTQVWQMASAAREIRATNPAGTDIVATLFAQSEVAEDQRHHQPEQVGQSSRRRILHHARRVNGTFVIDGVVGDYLCEKYRRPARPRRSPSAIEDNRLIEAHSRQQGTGARVLGLLPHRREQRPRRRVRHRHQHRRHATSSAISCRTKRFPASTSPSAIPTARTPAPTGIPPTHIDVVGRKFDIWIDGRQIMRDYGRFLIEPNA